MNPIARLKLAQQMISYNLKIVFANKFVYFLIAAFAFFFMVVGIMLFNDSSIEVLDMYNTLIFPAILIIFYPVIFNIQNDKEARMLEIIFAVPNYRYKVYLMRFAIAMLTLFVFLYIMGALSVFAVLRFSILPMVGQLMFPLFFIATLSFVMTTLVKNGSGAAAIIIIMGLLFWFFGASMMYSKWNLFLNPYDVPSDMNQNIWQTVITQNRIGLVVMSIVFLLWGLMNLQKREKFV